MKFQDIKFHLIHKLYDLKKLLTQLSPYNFEINLLHK